MRRLVLESICELTAFADGILCPQVLRAVLHDAARVPPPSPEPVAVEIQRKDVEQLMSYGFEECACMDALRACYGNFSQAADLMFKQDMDLSDDADGEEPLADGPKADSSVPPLDACGQGVNPAKPGDFAVSSDPTGKCEVKHLTPPLTSIVLFCLLSDISGAPYIQLSDVPAGFQLLLASWAMVQVGETQERLAHVSCLRLCPFSLKLAYSNRAGVVTLDVGTLELLDAVAVCRLFALQKVNFDQTQPLPEDEPVDHGVLALSFQHPPSSDGPVVLWIGATTGNVFTATLAQPVVHGAPFGRNKFDLDKKYTEATDNND